MGYVSDGRNRNGNSAPRTVGDSASKLMKMLDGAHYKAKLSGSEVDMIRNWIHIGAPYPGTYAALGTGMLRGNMLSKEYHAAGKKADAAFKRNCTRCHKTGGPAERYLLTGEPVLYKNAQRNWARSYLTLTGTPAKKYEPHQERGEANEIVNWISNSSEPTMIPPQYAGSTQSRLLSINDPDVSPCPATNELSREALDKLAAWIDLVVPFCGDYVEANAWTKEELRRAKERIALNRQAKEIDLKNVEAYIQTQ